MSAMLVSPHFLFRIEKSNSTLANSLQPQIQSKLSDAELASRLSFFLWSSIPDDELLNFGSGQPFI